MAADSFTIGTQAELLSFETVLDRDKTWPDSFDVMFKTDPESYRDCYVSLSKRDFEDLGSPDQITVRVRPGNALQAEQDAAAELS